MLQDLNHSSSVYFSILPPLLYICGGRQIRTPGNPAKENQKLSAGGEMYIFSNWLNRLQRIIRLFYSISFTLFFFSSFCHHLLKWDPWDFHALCPPSLFLIFRASFSIILSATLSRYKGPAECYKEEHRLSSGTS